MKYILIPVLFLFSFSCFSQKNISWKAHLKLADELYMKTVYSDAAEQYEAAWRKKPKKKELIEKAADCYYIIRDYKKAAAAFKHVKNERKDFPLAGLRYARSLKQSGKFDEASREFVYFIEGYKGDDKSTVERIVQNEIRGCELGIKFEAEKNQRHEVRHLGIQVNSPETEFAPIPFNENVLLFSSTMSNKARIYKTVRNATDWSKAELAAKQNFPQIPAKHLCNGAFSPDISRFYFTVCESKESWGGLTTRCEINMVKMVNGNWTAPQPLHEYINKPETTSTHPFVVHEGGQEILYFSSNRGGGKGGMDLWYSERDLNGDDIDFTVPVNLGRTINTIGDEITPFYDTEEGELYFSSNGQATIGGQDIFKAVGQRDTWSPPTNIGMPLNSIADDYYFIKTPNASNGFFSSNRVFGIEKITTTHEDIFEFVENDDIPLAASGAAPNSSFGENKPRINIPKSEMPAASTTPIIESEPEMSLDEIIASKTQETSPTTPQYDDNSLAVESLRPDAEPIVQPKAPPAKQITSAPTIAEEAITEVKLSGQVLNLGEQPVSKVSLSLYQIVGTGGRQLIKNQFVNDGNFDLKLDPDKYYYVEVRKDGYTVNSMEVYTGDGKYLNKNIVIERTKDFDYADVEENPPVNVRLNTSPKEKYRTEDNVSSYTESEAYTAPKSESIMPSTSLKNDYSGATYVARGQSKFDKGEFTTDAPRHQGEYYKIQVIAEPSFDRESSKYSAIRHLGRFDTEFLQKKKLHRVLLGDYFSLDNAKDILRTVQNSGFKRAFVVKYTDGQRYGMIYR